MSNVSSSIATLSVVEFKPREKIVNESCVSTLEEWLERAKAGDVITVAIAGLTNENSSTTQWSEIDAVSALLGAITILEARIVREVIQGD